MRPGFSMPGHFDEVTGNQKAAVDVSMLRGYGPILPTGRARNIADPGGKRFEDRIPLLEGLSAPIIHAVTRSRPQTPPLCRLHIVNASP